MLSDIFTELKRKAIHLSSIWIPMLYLYTDKVTMLVILSICTILFLYCDVSRHRNRFIAAFFGYFKNILRKEEKHQLTGASYLLISSLLVVVLFNQFTAITSIAVLIVADSFAAIFGKIFGKYKIVNNKTLEGSIAFFVSGLITCYYLIYKLSPGIHFYFSQIIVMLIVTYVELMAENFKMNDNLLIPFSVAFSMIIIDAII